MTNYQRRWIGFWNTMIWIGLVYLIVFFFALCVSIATAAETTDIVNRWELNGKQQFRVRVLDGAKVLRCVDCELPKAATEKQVSDKAVAILGQYQFDKTNVVVIEPSIPANEVRAMLADAYKAFTNTLKAAATKTVTDAWESAVKPAFGAADAKTTTATGQVAEVEKP